MSRIVSLTKFYETFFWDCTKFSVIPYTKTFTAVAGAFKKSTVTDEPYTPLGIIAGAVVCGILTTVVPILPALTTATVALSSIALLLAVASMFITYPIAVLGNLCAPSPQRASHAHVAFS